MSPDDPPTAPGRRAAPARPGLPTWVVLALAALFGVIAGVLAGVISAGPG